MTVISNSGFSSFRPSFDALAFPDKLQRVNSLDVGFQGGGNSVRLVSLERAEKID